MAKTVGVGITGGIAAYKIVDLVSKLKKDDLDVVVMMTKGACQFINPLTFRSLTGREVVTDLWAKPREYKVQHMSIAQQIDLLVIVPATANFIAKMAMGLANDFLSTLVLANTASVLVVPSMNTNMYKNQIVQENIRTLLSCGYHVMEPDSGLLANGEIGKGRLPGIENIYQEIIEIL
ncbi:MAG: flavoprotein [Syntrophomonas sp.]|nr:flavoprotein [Syntrophomonas sp.]